jgi:hypothetical protein
MQSLESILDQLEHLNIGTVAVRWLTMYYLLEYYI